MSRLQDNFLSILDENNPELSFKSLAEVRLYSKFFLKHDPIQFQCEFSTEEWAEFSERRQIQLAAQLDYLKSIDFSKANKTSVRGNYYKIAPKRFEKPLSVEGSLRKSSRFNYKDVEHLKNPLIYLGKSQLCCEVEKFHLEYQLHQMKEVHNRDDLDIKFNHIEEQIVYEFDVNLENILVLTTKPSCDAIRIPMGAYQNEWFGLNNEYEIPSSSQILGKMAQKHGFAGIMYTSIRSQTQHNLVIFGNDEVEAKITKISQKDFRPSFIS